MTRINDLQAQVVEQRAEIANLEARARASVTDQADAEAAVANDIAMQIENEPQLRLEIGAADSSDSSGSDETFINIPFDR
jgi:hypothetical protein